MLKSTNYSSFSILILILFPLRHFHFHAFKQKERLFFACLLANNLLSCVFVFVRIWHTINHTFLTNCMNNPTVWMIEHWWYNGDFCFCWYPFVTVTLSSTANLWFNTQKKKLKIETKKQSSFHCSHIHLDWMGLTIFGTVFVQLFCFWYHPRDGKINVKILCQTNEMD